MSVYLGTVQSKARIFCLSGGEVSDFARYKKESPHILRMMPKNLSVIAFNCMYSPAVALIYKKRYAQIFRHHSRTSKRKCKSDTIKRAHVEQLTFAVLYGILLSRKAAEPGTDFMRCFGLYLVFILVKSREMRRNRVK